jgi:hypothetical protein
VELTLNVDPARLAELREDARIYAIPIKVIIDPSRALVGALGSALGGAAAPVPGLAAFAASAAGAGVRREVHGHVEVEVEFPHPILWYPFIHEQGAARRYVVGSDTKDGTFCPLEVRAFNPTSTAYDRRLAERPEIELRDVRDRIFDADLLPQKVTNAGVWLPTNRVVIGADTAEGATLLAGRAAGHNPQAQNVAQPLPVWYERYPATIQIAIQPLDAPEQRWESPDLSVKGESIVLHCPKLPPDYAATVFWRLTDGPARMWDDGSGFVPRGEWQQTPLYPIPPFAGAQFRLRPGDHFPLTSETLVLQVAPHKELEIKLSVSKVVIRGNEEDWTTATVEVVSPTGADAINDLKATFHISGGREHQIDEGDPPQLPPDRSTWVVANWADEDTTMTIKAHVVAKLVAPGVFGQFELEADASIDVKVLGAAPQLVVSLMRTPGGDGATATEKILPPPGVQGPLLTLDLDGTSELAVAGELTLFGETYPDDLQLEVGGDERFFEWRTPTEPGVAHLPCRYVRGEPGDPSQVCWVNVRARLEERWFQSHYPDGLRGAFLVSVRPSGLRLKVKLSLSKDEIRGDEVDWTRAILEVVSPTDDADGLRVVSLEPEYDVVGAAKNVFNSPNGDEDPELAQPIGGLQPAPRKIGVVALWAEEDTTLTVKVHVVAKLDAPGGAAPFEVQTDASAEVRVLGAAPEFTVILSSTSRDGVGSAQERILPPPGVQGPLLDLELDGVSELRVAGELTVFDETYRDELRLDVGADARFFDWLNQGKPGEARLGSRFLLGESDVPSEVSSVRVHAGLDEQWFRSHYPVGLGGSFLVGVHPTAPRLEVAIKVSKDQIRGDEADWIHAELEVVSPKDDPNGPSLVSLKPNWKLILGHEPLEPFGPPRKEDDSWIDVVADWADENTKLTVMAHPVATLLAPRTAMRFELEADAWVQVTVIGAAPRLTVTVASSSGDGAGSAGLTLVPPEDAPLAPVLVLDLDGTSELTITEAELIIFGETYRDEVRLSTGVDQRFFDWRPRLEGNRAYHRARIVLGQPGDPPQDCRASVSAALDEEWFTNHYPDGLGGEFPLSVRTSVIRCSPQEEQRLPHEVEGGTQWKARLTARLESVSGRPIRWDTVLDDPTAVPHELGYRDWAFEFSYEQTASFQRLRLLDPGGRRTVGISAVDETGTITFGDPQTGMVAPYLDFDPWHVFGTLEDFYLRSQGCYVQVWFLAGEQRYRAGPIFVGRPFRMCGVRAIARSKEPLPDATVELVATDSGYKYSGQTDANGEVLFNQLIAGPSEPFTIAASWRSPVNVEVVFSGQEVREQLTKPLADGEVVEITLPCSTEWYLGTHGASPGMPWSETGVPGSAPPPRPAGPPMGAPKPGVSFGALLCTLVERTTSEFRVLAFFGVGPGIGLVASPGEALGGLLRQAQELFPQITVPNVDMAANNNFETEMPVAFEDFQGFGAVISADWGVFLTMSPGWAGFAKIRTCPPVWIGSYSVGLVVGFQASLQGGYWVLGTSDYNLMTSWTPELPELPW